MVDEQKLHHPLARLFDHGGVGLDDLPLGSGQRARRLRLGRPRRNLDQTHPAIARDGQPFVVAEPRDFLARQLARLEHGGPSGNVEFDAVYGDFRHAGFLRHQHKRWVCHSHLMLY
jgi:hypothetical protein